MRLFSLKIGLVKHWYVNCKSLGPTAPASYIFFPRGPTTPIQSSRMTKHKNVLFLIADDWARLATCF